MSDERVYDAERWMEIMAFKGWAYVGSFRVNDFHLGASFERVGKEREWPAGDYRLCRVDENGYAGAFYLYTLKVRHERIVEAEPTEPKVEAVDRTEAAA